MDTETKQIIGDTLTNIKFSGISWSGNKGFYYSSYDKPEGSELSEYTDRHKLYYHELNTDQKSDKTVFGDQEKSIDMFLEMFLTIIISSLFLPLT